MRLLEIESLTSEDLEAWKRLAERAAEPNPFFEPLFVPAAAGALNAGDVRLLVAGEGDAWIGCMPVQVRRALGVPMLVSTWKHPYSFLGTPLVDREMVGEYAAALADHLAARRDGRALLLRRCSVGPVLAALRDAAEQRAGVRVLLERSFERGAYRRRPADEHLTWMKSKKRSELRRQHRKLGEELGGEPAVRDSGWGEGAIDAFLALEASGWKGEGGTAMASDHHSAELFRRVCAEFGAAGRLQIRALEVGDRPLAMTCDLAAGDVLFGFKSAYDEELRRYSPGIQLQVDNFGFFDRERSEPLFDSCAEPTSETINNLWPDRREIATVAFGPAGPLGRLMGRALGSAYDARSKRST